MALAVNYVGAGGKSLDLSGQLFIMVNNKKV